MCWGGPVCPPWETDFCPYDSIPAAVPISARMPIETEPAFPMRDASTAEIARG